MAQLIDHRSELLAALFPFNLAISGHRRELDPDNIFTRAFRGVSGLNPHVSVDDFDKPIEWQSTATDFKKKGYIYIYIRIICLSWLRKFFYIPTLSSHQRSIFRHGPY